MYPQVFPACHDFYPALWLSICGKEKPWACGGGACLSYPPFFRSEKMRDLDGHTNITHANIDVDLATLPARVRNLALRIHSQLGLWPWQLLSSFPAIQRPDLNPTYWSVHTVESLSALVTRELEAESQREQNNTSDTTITATTSRTRSSRLAETTQAPDAHENTHLGVHALQRAVAQRIASQLAKAVDDRVCKQTKVSRSRGTIIPKRPYLTCQDIRTILNVDGDKDQGQDGGEGGPARKKPKGRQHYQPKAPQLRRPSQELGEDLDLVEPQLLDQDQEQKQQSPPTPVPAFRLDKIGPALRSSFRPESNSSPYGPLVILTEAAAAAPDSNMAPSPPHHVSPEDGNINIEVNRGGIDDGNRASSLSNTNGDISHCTRPLQPVSSIAATLEQPQHSRDRRLSTLSLQTLGEDNRNQNKRPRLSYGAVNSIEWSDYGTYGSHHTSEDGASLVFDLAPGSCIDDHERTTTTSLATTSHQETQRLRDKTTELRESLRQLRAKLAEAAKTVLNEEPSRRATEKVTKIQQELRAAETKLNERSQVEQSLESAIKIAGTTGTVSGLEKGFKDFQSETQQYASRITSLKATLAKAQEEVAELDAARLTAMQDKEKIEHDINETVQTIKKYEKRYRQWTTYANAIRLGPTNLDRLLERFPGMDKMLDEASIELGLRGADVEGEVDGTPGPGSG